MRIDSKQILFGQPVLKIRAVVRYAMSERLSGSKKEMIVEDVSRILDQSRTISKEVFGQLLKEKYLELKKQKFRDSFHYYVVETEKGRRFGIANADPSISRVKADQLLKELLERVEKLNANNELAYIIESVKVFGSYLSGKDVLGDLDVAIKLMRRVEGNEFKKLREKRIRIALQKGRQFSNFLQQAYWPQHEVILLLKTKKKGLSLHDEESDEVVNRTKCKIVYEYKNKK